MKNRLTKGQALVGVIVGEVQAAAGSIGTTELADNAVTDAKYTPTITSPSSTAPTVTVEGMNLLVSPGSSVGNVWAIGDPVAGQHHIICALSGVGGSSKPTCLKSTAATFDGTNKVLKFQADGAAREITANSTVRWIVVPDLACSTGVVAAATT